MYHYCTHPHPAQVKVEAPCAWRPRANSLPPHAPTFLVRCPRLGSSTTDHSAAQLQVVPRMLDLPASRGLATGVGGFSEMIHVTGCASGALACTVLQSPPAIRPCSSSPQALKVPKNSVPQHGSSTLKISPIFPAQGRHSLTRTWAHPLPQISNSPSWPASLNTLTRTLSSPLGLSQAYCPCLPIPAACPSAL